MYHHAFLARVLAIATLVLVGLLTFPLSVQHFRLKNRISQAQNTLQLASSRQMAMGSLMPELMAVAQRDPGLNAVFQKYGMPVPMAAPAPAAQPKPKKK